MSFFQSFKLFIYHILKFDYPAFISYRRNINPDIAFEIKKALDSRGVKTFLDFLDMPPGQFDQSLLTRIEHSKDFILLLSPETFTSSEDKIDYLKNEILSAFKLNKNIIPVFINNFSFEKAIFLPSEILFISKFHGVNYNIEHFDSSIDSVYKRLKSRLFVFFRYLFSFFMALFLIFILYFSIGDKIFLEKKEHSTSLKLINSSIAETFKLIYGKTFPGELPSASVEILFRSKYFNDVEVLKNGKELSINDLYRIVFQTIDDCYVYVFQIDSNGKLDWLFPFNTGSKFSIGSNPVKAGKWNMLPGNKIDDWFILDDHYGLEHIYIVAVKHHWKELEDYLLNASKAPSSSKPITDIFSMKTRGILSNKFLPLSIENKGTSDSFQEFIEKIDGVEGVLVIEKWFKHVPPISSLKPFSKNEHLLVDFSFLVERNGQDFVLMPEDSLKSNDSFKIFLMSNLNCYIYIFNYSPDNNINVLFPTPSDPHKQVLANQKVSIPESDHYIFIDGPKGIENLVVIASLIPLTDISKDFFKTTLDKKSLIISKLKRRGIASVFSNNIDIKQPSGSLSTTIDFGDIEKNTPLHYTFLFYHE